VTAKNIPKVLDNGYLEKLLSGVKEPAQRDLLEKQLNISVNTFLGFCHAREDHPNFKDGTVNNVEFDGLKRLAKEACQFKGPIIEIGTLFGYSTMALAIGKTKNKSLFTIDSFTWNPIGISSKRHEELTRKSLCFLTETQNVEIIKSSSTDFYANYDVESPSMIFIDAAHDYESVKQDIEFGRRVQSNIICGHDYNWPGVKQAVEESFGNMIETIGEIWVWREKS
jgi:hypothetical protein